jgi:hypothetical protein
LGSRNKTARDECQCKTKVSLKRTLSVYGNVSTKDRVHDEIQTSKHGDMAQELTQEEIESIQLTVVTALAASQLLHETMDDLAYTPFYRQSLKVKTKQFENELTKVMDTEINKMYGIDEKAMRSIQNGIQEVAKQLAHMDPAKIIVLGEMLKNGDIKFVK